MHALGVWGAPPQAQHERSVGIRGDQRDAGQREREAWQRELDEMNALLQDCHAMNPARFQDQDDLPALPDDDDSTDDEVPLGCDPTPERNRGGF